MSKRHPRQNRSFRRPSRESKLEGDIILIVCEGEKTEPDYFKGLKKEWKVHPAQIEIIGKECGNTPISVVEYAIKLKRERTKEAKKERELEFDEVWCVFDHEGIHKHESTDVDLLVKKLKSMCRFC